VGQDGITLKAIPSFERKNHVGVFIERKKSFHSLENFGTLGIYLKLASKFF
jgi:hypothetical protein